MHCTTRVMGEVKYFKENKTLSASSACIILLFVTFKLFWISQLGKTGLAHFNFGLNWSNTFCIKPFWMIGFAIKVFEIVCTFNTPMLSVDILSVDQECE